MKNNLFILIVFLFAALILFVQCGKDDSNPDPVTENVYVAGSLNTGNYTQVAVLWKNNSIIKLSDEAPNAKATSVFVSGSDIYVVGAVGKNAVLWKNGVATILTDGRTIAKQLQFLFQVLMFILPYWNMPIILPLQQQNIGKTGLLPTLLMEPRHPSFHRYLFPDKMYIFPERKVTFQRSGRMEQQ